jgi:hypothetical protein
MLATPSQTPELVSALATKITRGYSCVLCQQRKVKCDRQKPCSNCTKARVECVASTPTHPRRRRRKLTEIDLTARLRRYEHLLRTHGIKADEEDNDAHPETNSNPDGEREHLEAKLSMSAPRSCDAERGALFADRENSHYVEKYAPLTLALDIC